VRSRGERRGNGVGPRVRSRGNGVTAWGRRDGVGTAVSWRRRAVRCVSMRCRDQSAQRMSVRCEGVRKRREARGSAASWRCRALDCARPSLGAIKHASASGSRAGDGVGAQGSAASWRRRALGAFVRIAGSRPARCSLATHVRAAEVRVVRRARTCLASRALGMGGAVRRVAWGDEDASAARRGEGLRRGGLCPP
jgi:hypothetical protein